MSAGGGELGGESDGGVEAEKAGAGKRETLHMQKEAGSGGVTSSHDERDGAEGGEAMHFNLTARGSQTIIHAPPLLSATKR